MMMYNIPIIYVYVRTSMLCTPCVYVLNMARQWKMRTENSLLLSQNVDVFCVCRL